MIKATSLFKRSGLVSTLYSQTKSTNLKMYTFQTGVRDHDLLIYSMLKIFFWKSDPKRLVDRECSPFTEEYFFTGLSNSIENSQSSEAETVERPP